MTQTLHYSITPSNPAAHIYSIKLKIEQPDPIGQIIYMPACLLGTVAIHPAYGERKVLINFIEWNETAEDETHILCVRFLYACFVLLPISINICQLEQLNMPHACDMGQILYAFHVMFLYGCRSTFFL